MIMKCITTKSFSVLLVRIPCESFRPERGTRQDDSISPYIFIMCTNCLGRFICLTFLDKVLVLKLLKVVQ